ncbi:MAG TPA: hypothetical protein VF062_23215 [Candidatus Limnocylindrales bacterium]
MRRLAPVLLVLALTACAQRPEAATPTIGEPVDSMFPRVSQQALDKWASFPVDADPRPLVLIGDPVSSVQGFSTDNGKLAFTMGRIDPDGKVPPEAAEAFSVLTEAKQAAPPEVQPIKVISAVKGTAAFFTDRGAKQFPAWTFELTESLGPVAVLAVKPDFTSGHALSNAKVSADGMTLTVPMAKASEPCPGEARITYEAESLESATAVAVGLKPVTGEVAPGETGNCAHDLVYRTADYTIRLSKPLGNRVLVDASGNVLPVSG